MIAHRPGALERVQLLAEDRDLTKARLAETERRMTALATSITGLSAIGAAAILAETGDPRRFATARAVVKHAGLAPQKKLSGAFTGRTRLTGQGRPGLRLAALARGLGSQRANPVCAAVPDAHAARGLGSPGPPCATGPAAASSICSLSNLAGRLMLSVWSI